MKRLLEALSFFLLLGCAIAALVGMFYMGRVILLHRRPPCEEENKVLVIGVLVLGAAHLAFAFGTTAERIAPKDED